MNIQNTVERSDDDPRLSLGRSDLGDAIFKPDVVGPGHNIVAAPPRRATSIRPIRS